MNNNSKLYSRRFTLKSAGACITLPFLESLAGAQSFGSGLLPVSTRAAAAGLSVSANGIPKRLVFLPMGYGVSKSGWFPSVNQPGSDYDLPPLVQPFADVKKDISFIQNLMPVRMPTPHSATSRFLNCIPASSKDEILNSAVSCDQMAAEVIGRDTRFDYLTLGAPGRADGHGALPSYGRDGKPAGAHRSIKSLYASLFGRGVDPEKIKEQLQRNESSLDALVYDAKKLKRQVSNEDSDRIDEYFTSIRNVEKRISKAQEWAKTPYPKAPFTLAQIGHGPKLMELVFDMMVIAMQSDSARVLTYVIPTQLVLKSGNTHRMSHKASGDFDPARPTVHQDRDLALSLQVSKFLQKLKDTKERDGSSLLDNSLIAYGTGLRAGHGVGRGPMILAGHGGGGLKQGQNVITKDVPMANLWLSMLRHVGIKDESFANSTGVISEMGFT